MKILAVYGSHFGQAEAVLRKVVGVLETRGHTVSVYKGDAVPSSNSVADFDAVVVAASIVMGRYQGYIRDFVKSSLAALSARPTAFISVNGAAPESSPEWQEEAQQFVRQFLTETRWEPRWTATFAGAIRYSRYGLVTRWIMKMIQGREGGPTDTSVDREFTDWQAVERFGEVLADGLAVQPPTESVSGAIPQSG